MSASVSNETERGPLAGLRVLELGQMIAGPFCGHLLADYGAEVIKIEPPKEGDVMRHWGVTYKGLGLYWPLISRGKKSVTVDLRVTEGQEMLRALADAADVVVENFRPGTLERWGIGWDRLSVRNPRLIMVRISGFGQTGPYRGRAGFGAIGEAMSGFRYLSGERGRPPVRCGISIGDALVGTHGLIGALLALYVRDRRHGSARGQVVDVGIYEAMWAYMEGILAEYEKVDRIREPSGPTLPGIGASNVYPTCDGSWIVVGANADAVFRRFALALGRPEWIQDESPYATFEGRGQCQARLDAEVVEWSSSRTAEEVLRALEEASVPASRLYTAKDIAGDPHFAARDMIITVSEPNLGGEDVRMQGVIPKLSATPGHVTRGAPLLGEHSDEILAPLVGARRLADLRARNII